MRRNPGAGRFVPGNIRNSHKTRVGKRVSYRGQTIPAILIVAINTIASITGIISVRDGPRLNADAMIINEVAQIPARDKAV